MHDCHGPVCFLGMPCRNCLRREAQQHHHWTQVFLSTQPDVQMPESRHAPVFGRVLERLGRRGA